MSHALVGRRPGPRSTPCSADRMAQRDQVGRPLGPGDPGDAGDRERVALRHLAYAQGSATASALTAAPARTRSRLTGPSPPCPTTSTIRAWPATSAHVRVRPRKRGFAHVGHITFHMPNGSLYPHWPPFERQCCSPLAAGRSHGRTSTWAVSPSAICVSPLGHHDQRALAWPSVADLVRSLADERADLLARTGQGSPRRNWTCRLGGYEPQRPRSAWPGIDLQAEPVVRPAAAPMGFYCDEDLERHVGADWVARAA